MVFFLFARTFHRRNRGEFLIGWHFRRVWGIFIFFYVYNLKFTIALTWTKYRWYLEEEKNHMLSNYCLNSHLKELWTVERKFVEKIMRKFVLQILCNNSNFRRGEERGSRCFTTCQLWVFFSMKKLTAYGLKKCPCLLFFFFQHIYCDLLIYCTYEAVPLKSSWKLNFLEQIIQIEFL